MAFLNGRKKTRLGLGLGMEITSSMFFYSRDNTYLSLFSGIDPDSRENKYSSRLIEYIRSGWIDTNHAFGDFDYVGGFTREHAEYAYAFLYKNDCMLKVFTNHGTEHNTQNIGGTAPHHRGDVRGDDCYHADLLRANGVEYIWRDGDVIEPQIRKSLRSRISEIVREDPNKNIVDECMLQDGTALTRFIRFRGTGANAPNLSSLNYQLSWIDWDKYYKNYCCVILYQHLGVAERIGGVCIPAEVGNVIKRPEVYLSSFYRLSKEYHTGKLWVVGLERMLRYINMISNVDIAIDRCDKDVNRVRIINLSKKSMPASALQGITIYIDTKKRTEIEYQGEKVPFVVNGPDDTSRYSVTVPITKLNDIWE